MGYQNGKFLSFENFTFWYPFVLVPVWVPPNVGCGGLKQVDLSFCVLPCFAVFGDRAKKCHCHTPFGVPKMLVKTRT